MDERGLRWNPVPNPEPRERPRDESAYIGRARELAQDQLAQNPHTNTPVRLRLLSVYTSPKYSLSVYTSQNNNHEMEFAKLEVAKSEVAKEKKKKKSNERTNSPLTVDAAILFQKPNPDASLQPPDRDSSPTMIYLIVNNSLTDFTTSWTLGC